MVECYAGDNRHPLGCLRRFFGYGSVFHTMALSRDVMLCRYWEVDIWDNVFDELLNADYRATGAAGPEAVLGRLDKLLSSYIKDYKRSCELQEFLRRQDNMLGNR